MGFHCTFQIDARTHSKIGVPVRRKEGGARVGSRTFHRAGLMGPGHREGGSATGAPLCHNRRARKLRKAIFASIKRGKAKLLQSTHNKQRRILSTTQSSMFFPRSFYKEMAVSFLESAWLAL